MAGKAVMGGKYSWPSAVSAATSIQQGKLSANKFTSSFKPRGNVPVKRLKVLRV